MAWEIPNEDAARDAELNRYLDDLWRKVDDDEPCDDLDDNE